MPNHTRIAEVVSSQQTHGQAHARIQLRGCERADVPMPAKADAERLMIQPPHMRPRLSLWASNLNRTILANNIVIADVRPTFSAMPLPYLR